MKKQRLYDLFQLYMQQRSTETEESELMDLLADPEMRTERDGLLEEWMERVPEEEGLSQSRADEIFKSILVEESSLKRETKLFPMRRLWWAAAAVLLLCIGTYYGLKKKDVPDNIVAESKIDVKPGSYKATLKLGNGAVITLDSANKGLIAKQGSSVVNKMNNGEIAYNKLDEKPEVQYNTLETPMGGQYKLVLPDGSKVWLNAASSIYFPTAFTGKERNVTITGEAYFEVAHDARRPFVVAVVRKPNADAVNGQRSTVNEKGLKPEAQSPTRVTVLGTHFNINSYADESSQQITLLEGSVKVTNALSGMKLSPGEQAEISLDDKMLLRKAVDTDQITSWKNGVFEFQQADIQTIMRQIGRWYDLEIVYEGKISIKKFDGIISRDKNLKEVLKIMEAGGIKFRIEGKKLIVKS